MQVLIIETQRYRDARGWFSETWSAARMAKAGIAHDFVQDNQSCSVQVGTLRGLHFQRPPFAQAKLVRCLKGRIFDVAVDIRPQSPTFGHWVGAELSAEDGRQMLVPRGMAHGFLTLEPDTEVAYKVDNPYAQGSEGGIRWDDPAIAIDWPLAGLTPLLSDKDAQLPGIAEALLEFAYDGNPLQPIRTITV